MRAVAFDLLVGGDGAEDNFGKAAGVKGAVGDATYDFERMFDYGKGEMGAVVYETGNVLFWHFGKLFLENAFEAGEDHEGLRRAIVVGNAEFDLAVAFFNHGRFFREGNDIDGFSIDRREGDIVRRRGV